MLLFPEGEAFTYTIIGTIPGVYDWTARDTNQGVTTTFMAVELPINASTTHQYTIDFDALAQGEQGVTLEIDEDGDGIVERVVFSNTELTDITFPTLTLFPPIQKEPRIFQAGRAIPIEFQLSDANGDTVTDASTSLFFARIENGSTTSFQSAQAEGKSNTGNVFRIADKKYIYNWNTKELEPGTYRLRIDLDDTTQHFIDVKLRKGGQLAALAFILGELSTVFTKLSSILGNLLRL